jgi:hypothetical protein
MAINPNHFQTVLDALTDGRVVPLLGAGVNLSGRPANAAFAKGQYLPNGTELVAYLKAAKLPVPAAETDLLRVSQYIALQVGSGPLYEKLHELFDANYPPTSLHKFLAALPGRLRQTAGAAGGAAAAGAPSASQSLILTTNYDDVLERAFDDAGEAYDLVSYVAEGEDKGKFVHRKPDGTTALIDRPNEYRAFDLSRRTVILKIHGAVDRKDPERDSYVITEDHYIDYLTRADIASLVPVQLAAKMRKSHFLFLGYSLRDWNLRVILYRIWGEQRLTYTSWAVQNNATELDKRFWGSRGVEILEGDLEEYVAGLEKLLPPAAGAAPPAGGGQ